MRSELARVENPVGPAISIPLDHAFAPLKLLQEGEGDRPIDLFEHASETQVFMLLGGPGTGKTTLMKSLIVRILNGRCPLALSSLTPVYLSLRKIGDKTLFDAIMQALDEYGFSVPASYVNALINNGSLFLVLDGLDEVGVNRTHVVDQIRAFCVTQERVGKRSHVVITCRESSYRARDLHDVVRNIVRIEPFAPHHMRIFLSGWPAYKGKHALSLFPLIQADPQIRAACSNPLLLTILTGLYLESSFKNLPESRKDFYELTIDELLTQRPQRKGLSQKYPIFAKTELLEHLSMQALETASRSQDPEAFDFNAIKKIAKTLDVTEPTELVHELVNVNGIIRTAGEHAFTFSHRTIQEYFAAAHAHRTRTVNQVLANFSANSVMREVLYFYCALNVNMPTLDDILTHFSTKKDWELAGRCILNASMGTSTRATSLFRAIADGLRSLGSVGRSLTISLEVLSLLAQRQGSEFDPFRDALTAVVTQALSVATKTAVSGLGSALAASPELAQRLIPAMLESPIYAQKKTAVWLLRDLGDMSSLERMVQLLLSVDGELGVEVASALASLVSTRAADLRTVSGFLPEVCEDGSIWPLSKYFPARIALPMASKLVGAGESGNQAIDCAARATAIQRGMAPDDTHFTGDWRRVGFAVWAHLWRQRVSAHAAKIGLCVATAWIAIGVGLTAGATDDNNIVYRSSGSLTLKHIEIGRWTNVIGAARNAVADYTSRRMLTDFEKSHFENRPFRTYKRTDHDPNGDPFILETLAAGEMTLEQLLRYRPKGGLDSTYEMPSLTALALALEQFRDLRPGGDVISVRIVRQTFYMGLGLAALVLFATIRHGGTDLKTGALLSSVLVLPVYWVGVTGLNPLAPMGAIIAVFVTISAVTLVAISFQGVRWPRNSLLDAALDAVPRELGGGPVGIVRKAGGSKNREDA